MHYKLHTLYLVWLLWIYICAARNRHRHRHIGFFPFYLCMLSSQWKVPFIINNLQAKVMNICTSVYVCVCVFFKKFHSNTLLSIHFGRLKLVVFCGATILAFSSKFMHKILQENPRCKTKLPFLCHFKERKKRKRGTDCPESLESWVSTKPDILNGITYIDSALCAEKPHDCFHQILLINHTECRVCVSVYFSV